MSNKTLFRGFTLINGTGENPYTNAYLLVEDEKILRVGSALELEPREDVEIVDLYRKTVMPYNHYVSNPEEIKLMIECGIEPMDALVNATKSSAVSQGIIDNYGTLDVGKYADFLVLNDSPMENLDTLFNINSVYRSGKRVQ